MNGDFVHFFPTEGLNTEFTMHVILLLKGGEFIQQGPTLS